MYEFVIFLAVIVIKYSPKTAIWLGAIIVLRRIRDKVSKKKPEKEIGEFTIEISKLIEALIPKEILELNQNNKHWDRQLFSGIEFVTKQIKDPKRTAYARSYDN